MELAVVSVHDTDAHSCADVASDALADVLVRACLHAPYHARCGLTGTHAQACTMDTLTVTALLRMHPRTSHGPAGIRLRPLSVDICAATVLWAVPVLVNACRLD